RRQSCSELGERQQKTPEPKSRRILLNLMESGEKVRNLIAFWLLGLCNNYAYVVMLSAAHDILSSDFSNSTTLTVNEIREISNSTRDCNKMSTAAILLADIAPSFLVKVFAPFILTFTRCRVVVMSLLTTASFLLVSFSTELWMAFLGVVCAAISGGLGEVTLLQYSARYNKNVVSTWASGTGGSGIFGALSYAGLTLVGFSPRHTLLLMLVVPFILIVSFFFVLERKRRPLRIVSVNSDGEPLLDEEEEVREPKEDYLSTEPELYTFKEKINMIPTLLKYMIPVGLVYLFEYTINQGMLELVYFPDAWLDHSSQYRWFLVTYQLGVFIARSSVNLIHIQKIWILTIFQFVNLILLSYEAVFLYLPSIWIAFIIVFWEGLIGGAAYVNTFYKISHELSGPRREFAMGATSLADCIGILTAAAVSMPIHTLLCSLPVPE
ncbi:hypothetical protein QYM36_005845, partial [Artemia franciscana]